MHSKDPGSLTDPGIVPGADTAHGNPAPRRPNQPTTLTGKLMALLHGDKYMMNAYPPQWHEPAGTSPAAPDAVVCEPAAADALER
jgi:hypothetical protein